MAICGGACGKAAPLAITAAWPAADTSAEPTKELSLFGSRTDWTHGEARLVGLWHSETRIGMRPNDPIQSVQEVLALVCRQSAEPLSVGEGSRRSRMVKHASSTIRQMHVVSARVRPRALSLYETQPLEALRHVGQCRAINTRRCNQRGLADTIVRCNRREDNQLTRCRPVLSYVADIGLLSHLGDAMQQVERGSVERAVQANPASASAVTTIVETLAHDHCSL